MSKFELKGISKLPPIYNCKSRVIQDHLVLYPFHSEDKLFGSAIILFHNFYRIGVS